MLSSAQEDQPGADLEGELEAVELVLSHAPELLQAVVHFRMDFLEIIKHWRPAQQLPA